MYNLVHGLPVETEPDSFVKSVVVRYNDYSTRELKELCYKILDEYGIKPGEKIFEKIRNASSRKHQ